MTDKKYESEKLNNITLMLIFLMLCCVFGHATQLNLFKFFEFILIFISMIKLLLGFKNKFFVKYKTTFKYIIWYVIFILYLNLSSKWSINSTASLELVKGIQQTFILIFPIVVYSTDESKVKNIFKALMLSHLYMCLRLILFETATPGTIDFGSAIGYHFNRIATTLSYGILISFYLYKSEKKKIYLFPIIIFYYIILLTGSRKGLLMPIAFISLFMSINMFKNIKIFLKNIIIIVGLILLLFFIFNSNSTLKARVDDLFNSIVNNAETDDGSINERKYFRQTAMELFKIEPIHGIGANGFRSYLVNIGYNKTISYSHCNYTELLATLGIIGFILYYIMYIIILKKSFIGLNSTKYCKILSISYIIIQTIFEYGFVSFYMFEFQVVLAIMFLNSEYGNGEILK